MMMIMALFVIPSLLSANASPHLIRVPSGPRTGTKFLGQVQNAPFQKSRHINGGEQYEAPS